MKKPLIGVVLDKEPQGDYSIYPYYVMREHYFDVIKKAGGIPIGIPHMVEHIDAYAQLVDGLLLPGGGYDIPPSFYGETVVHSSVVTKTGRLDFDVALVKKFLDVNIPILGICAGQQLLAVLHGGTLIQDIASEIGDSINHYQELRTEPAHEITIIPGTVLHQVLGETSLVVNSHHHQAVRKNTGSFVVSAESSDGIVEGIEIPGQRFCIGVEWHPEFLNLSEELKLFEAFVNSCRE